MMSTVVLPRYRDGIHTFLHRYPYYQRGDLREVKDCNGLKIVLDALGRTQDS